MEKEMAIKDYNSFVIHGWMRTKLKLSGNALMIYSIIFGFSQDNQSAFYGTRQYLSDFIGASRPTVDKALNELCELGYIIKESVEIKNVLFNNFKINFDILENVNFNDTYKETLQGHKETLHNDNKEYNKELNNKDNTYKEKENIKEKSDKFQKPTLEELQAYINEKGYHFSAEAFIDYYDSVGWKIGKSPMISWKSACSTWERKYKENNSYKNPYSSGDIPRETAYPDLKKNYL